MTLFSNLFGASHPLRPGDLFRTDMHAHWLPGIDDGAPDVETSLALVGGLYDLGYRRLMATPHIYPEFYPNTPDSIRVAYEQVVPAIRRQWPDLETGYAAEYFLDDAFRDKVDRKELLPVMDDRVLVEFSFLAEPPGAEEIFFRMQLKGYRPVLAHVERYPFLFGQDRKLDRFRDMGVIFQGNLLSLTGRYGPGVRKQAVHLLQKGYYDWWCTDCHHVDHLAQLKSLRIPGSANRAFHARTWNG